MPYRRRTRRSSGRRRRPNYEWARTGWQLIGSQSTDYHFDLLTQYREASGSDPVDCTVVRVLGLITPYVPQDTTGYVNGTFALSIMQQNIDTTFGGFAPNQAPNWNWMAYMPFGVYMEADHQAPYAGPPATWRKEASPWVVDVKSSRRIERLGETLWLSANRPNTVGLQFNLSVLLKKP